MLNSGVILLAHGSRRDGANDVMDQLVGMVREASDFTKVNSAFLQFSRPTLQEALKEQVDQGIKEVTVMPVFLFNGIHLSEDIPQILEQEKEKYPSVKILTAKALGMDRRIAEIVKDRIKEAREGV